MLLTLPLRRINPLMRVAAIDELHAAEGTLLPVGSKLLDLTIDLSEDMPQDCPPISHYRIVLREVAWLRRWLVAPGEQPEVGTVLAMFSSEADESLDAAPLRSIRNMTAGIVRAA